jgi:hypothetical protein
VGPPPRGSQISETTLQNRRMAKLERFQEFDGQRFLVFAFNGQNQTSTIVRWPKMDFFLQLTMNCKIIIETNNIKMMLIEVSWDELLYYVTVAI